LDANEPSWNGSYWDTHCTDSGSWYCYDYCQNRVIGTSITLKIGYNSPYDFWIHSRSSTGQWSDASHLSFTCPKIPPPPPSNLNAQCSSDGKSVTLSWSGTGVKYALRLDKNPPSWDEWRWCSIGCNGWDWATGDYCKDFVYSQSITLDVEPNTKYMWWVHALDNQDVWSSNSLSYFECTPSQCGNGKCESGENCSNCPSDCPCPSGQVCQNGVCVQQCSCTSWVNQGCGKGGCPSNYMYQTRTCTPSGCDAESQCVYSSSCANNPPSAINLKVTQPDYCKVGPGATIFSWKFTDSDGDSQSAYQVQVDNNSNFSSPEVDSGKINSSSNSYSPQTGLSYNTTYYWRVRVWDSKGNVSSWSYGSSFTTPKHVYPTPDFIFSPDKPQPGQVVQFTDKSQAFGGAKIESWYWTFQNGNPSASTNQNPTTTFSSIGESEIILEVTDSSNYSCSVKKFLRTTYPLPFWKEIPPF
jgi:plastocyanin